MSPDPVSSAGPPWEHAGRGRPRRTEPTHGTPLQSPNSEPGGTVGPVRGGCSRASPVAPQPPVPWHHVADVPVLGTPPALLPWGHVAVPSLSAPPPLLPSKGKGDGGGSGGGGYPWGPGGAWGCPGTSPSLCSSPPAAAVTRRAAGTATRRPRTPSSLTGTGQRPGVPEEPGQGVPGLGAGCERCLVSANDLGAALRSLFPLLCCLCSWHSSTGSCPAPWGTGRSPPPQHGPLPADGIGWHRTRQRLVSTQMLAPAALCSPTDPHLCCLVPCVPMSRVPTS